MSPGWWRASDHLVVERMAEQQAGSGAKAWLRATIALGVLVAVIAAVVAFDPDRAQRWITALHVMAVISWMAGLLYLPRLFIYHSETETGSPSSELFKVMERRLYRVIMNPAMMLSWVLGLYLAWSVYRFQPGWLHVKLTAVVGLTAAHVYFGRAVAAFGRDERPGSQRRWRLLNEVPALLMIIIVIMVIVQPF
jgi:putative membrane protein